MLSLGLTAAQHRQYLTTLATGYDLKVTVQLLRADHSVVQTVSEALMDGQVDVIAPKYNGGDVEVSRTAMLTLLDRGTLALDSTSPANGAFYMDRMVRIIYSVRCPFGWVDVPVFTGPIVKVDRDGDFVDVECHGKERYALQAAWVTGTEKGRKSDVMLGLMQRTGEATRYTDFLDTKTTVSKPVSIGRAARIWALVWKVNASMGRILFYDGRGVAVSRKKSYRVAMVLKDGLGGFVTGDPQVSYSTDDAINAVRVTGKKGSKGKATPSATALPPSSHPLHPLKLGRRGKGLYLTGSGDEAIIENQDLKTTAACRAVAVETLADGLMQHVEVPIETLPIPHLEPWDLLQVSTARVSAQIRATAFTLPLVQRGGQGTSMTIGSTRDVRKPRRPIRKA